MRGGPRRQADKGHALLLAPSAGDLFPGHQLAQLTVSRADLRSFLNSYSGTYSFSYINEFDHTPTPVYRVTGPKECAGG